MQDPDPAVVHGGSEHIGEKCQNHGINIRWKPINRCERKAQCMLIDMFKHLVTSTAVTNRIFLSEKTFFFMRAQHVMSYHIIYKYHGQNERLSSDIKKYIFFCDILFS